MTGLLKSKIEFHNFLDLIISENKLKETVKEKFKFLPYEQYVSEMKVGDKFIVYEDWQQRKPEVVKSKIKSILQISKRIYGRLCELKKISKPEADNFIRQNHIYDTTNSKIKYGLFYKNKLVSVATFAAQRQFRDGSRSVELLRFCSEKQLTVIGGLDKLLQAYIKEYQPDTIMTYIDLDWGTGDAFKKLGFEITDKRNPEIYFVNKKTGKRIHQKYFNDTENLFSYVTVKNSGSLKMIKQVS